MKTKTYCFSLLALLAVLCSLTSLAQSGWTDPDAWMETIKPTDDLFTVIQGKNRGFTNRLDSGFYVDVAIDMAPATPLADLTTTSTKLCDRLYGFPDGRVDADDLQFFMDLWFKKFPGLDIDGCKNAVAGDVDEQDLRTFMDSYLENANKSLLHEQAYAVVSVQEPGTFSWAYRMRLYRLLRQILCPGPLLPPDATPPNVIPAQSSGG